MREVLGFQVQGWLPLHPDLPALDPNPRTVFECDTRALNLKHFNSRNLLSLVSCRGFNP